MRKTKIVCTIGPACENDQFQSDAWYLGGVLYWHLCTVPAGEASEAGIG